MPGLADDEASARRLEKVSSLHPEPCLTVLFVVLWGVYQNDAVVTADDSGLWGSVYSAWRCNDLVVCWFFDCVTRALVTGFTAPI